MNSSWCVGAALVLLAWGTLAFGGVYAWAFIPLLIGCAGVGIASLLVTGYRHRIERSVVLGLIVLMAAIALQLVPLPGRVIRALSPATSDFLSRYLLGYTNDRWHPLSIQPVATVWALAAIGSCVLLWLGLCRIVKRNEARNIVRSVIALGLILAVVGMVQRALWNGKIYGFWTPDAPPEMVSAFGPFVNRNHFAGWMLMALPLAVGHLCSRALHGFRHVKPGIRNRLLWLSSANASEVILTGFAIALMALALMLTTSRSGIVGLMAALVTLAWFLMRRQTTKSRRTLVAAYLVFVAVTAAGWGGVDRVAARFSTSSVNTMGGRLQIWRNAAVLPRLFPVAGTGLNTFGVAMLFYQTADLDEHLAQAHNDYLQLAGEGGLLVGIPLLGVLTVLIRAANRRFHQVTDAADYWIRVGAVTGAVAIAVQEVSDFSLQMPGNAVLFVLLLVLLIRPPEKAINNLS